MSGTCTRNIGIRNSGKRSSATRKLFTGALLVTAALLAACETVQTTQPGTVGVNREQRMAISEGEFNQGAAQAYQQMMSQAQQKGETLHVTTDPEHVHVFDTETGERLSD